MSAALVSPFSDFSDVRFQQHKTRSQSMSVAMLGMSLEHQQPVDSRTRHGSSGSGSNMFLGGGGQAATASMATISQQQLPPHGDTTSLFSSNARNLGAPGHLNSVNTTYNTANHSSVPTFHRKLDRSVSEPGDRNVNLQSSKNQAANINSTRYKTELCRPFEENGYCKYGDKCQFAHGSHEQRSLARHPKYKTELCRTFHTVGFCPYGPCCHFIHNEDERRLGQIVQMKQQQAAVQALQVQQAAVAQNTLQQIQQQLQQQQQSAMTLPPAISRSHSVSSPTPVQRPKTLNFSLSLNMPAVSRDTLGSTADSPPSSFTDSPTMSPSTLADDFLAVSLALCNTPPASAPAAVTSAFTYPELGQALPSTPTPIMTPLNIHTDQAVVSLAAGLQAASLKNSSVTNDVLRDLNDSFCTPPSPPDSLNGDSIMNVCESPLDVSRNLRLPIFSRLANED